MLEKFTLEEVLQLETEINGYTNPSGKQIVIGFLKTNLPIILKYELNSLSKILLEEKKNILSLRDDLIKKYGEKQEDQIFIQAYIEKPDKEGNMSKIINPQFTKFSEEYSTLLSQIKEFEIPEITKDILKNSGNTTDNYNILFKLIKS